jgi:peroxiredoxin
MKRLVVLTLLLVFSYAGCSESNSRGSCDEPQSAQARFDALFSEYEAKDVAFRKVYRVARTDAEKIAAIKLRPDPEAYAEKLLPLACEIPEGPDAADALYRTMLIARSGPVVDAVLGHFRSHYVTSPKMADYCRQIGTKSSFDIVEPLLREVLSKNPDRAAQGHARLALANRLDLESRFRSRYEQDPEQAKAMDRILGKKAVARMLERDHLAMADEAESLHEQVAERYADVQLFPSNPASDTRTIGQKATQWLEQKRELAVGRKAPEIEGHDVDGKVFRLSDYRGKVVVVAFWASWCPPCLEQVPHERELARRLEGQPFAMLGVNCDRKADAARVAIGNEGITWPNWFDGNLGEGPITKRYRIPSIPRVYVLDGAGVIRYKDVRGHALGKSVDTLMSERGVSK